MDLSSDQRETDIENNDAMLTPTEARVLGSLMEKQMTTPDVYPLTLNSLVLACNQKTSREPVMNLQNGEVQRCLNQLEARDLVEIEYGSRADKFKQKLSKALSFDKAEQAIFCLMLLRGPQTVNELFSRSHRMFDFGSATKVQELLETLLGKLKPLVVKIPAQAGQREDRYTHLLCGEPDLSALPKATASRAVDHSAIDELTQRVEILEKQVADLMAKLS
ncbi:YceH family protein [Reinekea sp. G2M2-21]|uniref:YceH family protein n=1 Tax=Reinekea sp. G2M2-21 TaxID=2788942 RepID=UPI0018AA4A0E|nr:YceH family protein [Reinekea sp. G2M2-21]